VFRDESAHMAFAFEVVDTVRREEPDLFDDELKALVLYQLGALAAIARARGAKLFHVKAHGALYNQAAKDARQERLKLALRENLKRRKSQARERSDFTPSSSASDEVSRDSGEESPGK